MELIKPTVACRFTERHVDRHLAGCDVAMSTKDVSEHSPIDVRGQVANEDSAAGGTWRSIRLPADDRWLLHASGCVHSIGTT